jgi:hypothetical protein
VAKGLVNGEKDRRRGVTQAVPDLLEAQRLPALCRGVCLYAGLPLPPATAGREWFVVRTGAEPPELLARLLAEGLVDDGFEVLAEQTADEPAAQPPIPGLVVVRPGHAAACPDGEELRRAVAPGGGPVLVFAVERRDLAGRLLGVTWAAVPEEEPPPQAYFRAAIRSYECDLPEESTR